MLRALKWITAIGVGLTLIGAITISMAIRAYPQSNLLGGWGLILGPIYWLGLLLCIRRRSWMDRRWFQGGRSSAVEREQEAR
jgi:hypothetical protein